MGNNSCCIGKREILSIEEKKSQERFRGKIAELKIQIPIDNEENDNLFDIS